MGDPTQVARQQPFSGITNQQLQGAEAAHVAAGDRAVKHPLAEAVRLAADGALRQAVHPATSVAGGGASARPRAQARLERSADPSRFALQTPAPAARISHCIAVSKKPDRKTNDRG